MKPIPSLLVVIGFLTFCSCDSNDNVPIPVKETFNRQYTEVNNETWRHEEKGIWESQFSYSGKEYSVKIKDNGEWIETEYEIEISAGPSNVLDKVRQEYPTYRIEEAEIVNTNTDGTLYELEIILEEDQLELLINENGDVILEHHENENDENDNDD